MAAKINNMIDKGSVWTTVDKTFQVNDVIVKDDGTWIYYTNTKTGEEFSCLVEAFLERFNHLQ